MTTQISWYYPERVVYVSITDTLAIEDMIAGHQRNIELINSVDHDYKVHFIFDSSEMKQGPSNFLEIRRAGKDFLAHPRLGWSVGIGESTLIRFVSTTIAQITGVKHRGFHYLEDGIQFLQDVDMTLPELPRKFPEVDPLHTIG